MRFIRSKYKPHETHVIKRFALFPITIGMETRWLETVYIKAYYWIGPVSNKTYWEYEEFVERDDFE